MLYLVSNNEDPTGDDCGVYEASSVKLALDKAAADGWGEPCPTDSGVHVFEIKKSSRKHFVAERKLVWSDKTKGK